MTVDVTYQIPSNGLGTDFSEFERPSNFASAYTNRFRNINGGAERRPGMQRFGSKIPSLPNLTRLHEFVSDTGTETIMASDDFGNIYKYNTSTSAWSTVYTGGARVRYISAFADGKLVFVNGVDRNIYTDNAGDSFHELKAIITKGKTAGGTNTTTLVDGDVSNWIGATLVANNDIVYNSTRGGYGIVTAVASAALTTTIIGGTGAGGSGEGQTTTNTNQQSGDAYELIDHVDLNVIPRGASNNSDGLGYDNVGVLTSGTSVLQIAVSGVDFSTTEIRKGDIVYNTTRGIISFVNTVSANVALTKSISGQVAGDSIALFKSAMPISSWVHIHYGRGYFLDSRNNNRVVITAPDDLEDVTTYQKTLDSSSFSFGTQSPQGDTILSMGTFLSYFVAAGKKNLYIYKGNTPIADAAGTTITFEPIAMYPNGTASRFGLATNGSDFLYMAYDGLHGISLGYNTSNTIQNNASMPIRNTLLNAIAAISNTDNIQVTNYPRRQWTLCKIGSQCYVLNTNPSYDNAGQLINGLSWHLFTGAWANLNHYFVRRNGDLLGCGANGLVYYLDSSASTDDGSAIPTDFQTSWLRIEEPQKTPRIKEGKYIRPIFESSPDIGYTISVNAGLDNFSSDTIDVSAGGTGAIGTFVIGTTPIGGGSFAQGNKYPLRWRGEEFRLQITSESSAQPDVITAFTVYGNICGRR